MDSKKRRIITRAQIEYIFMCLRHIDRAVKVLEVEAKGKGIEGVENLLGDLRETADKIYTTIKETPEAD
jgi:hypothetical protein